MTFGDPVHGEWCNSRTWPSCCRYCGSSVYFFMCDHGSRVFFNSLGDPWPRHRCQAFAPPEASFTPSISGGKARLTPHITIELASLREQNRVTPSSIDEPFSLQRSLLDRIQRNAKRSTAKDPIVSADAERERKTTRDGVVRELHKQADPFKDLKLQRTGMAAKFVGPLGSGRLAKLTIHAGSLSDDQLESYTFFVHREQLDHAQKGRVVRVTLEAYGVPGGKHLWYCVALSSLD